MIIIIIIIIITVIVADTLIVIMKVRPSCALGLFSVVCSGSGSGSVKVCLPPASIYNYTGVS